MKTLLSFLLVALCGITTIPAHATLYTLSTSGTISSGTDDIGLFGTVGADLTGKTIEWQQTFDSTLLDQGGDPPSSYLSGSPAGVSGNIVVGGVGHSEPAGGSTFQVLLLQNGVSSGVPNYMDGIYGHSEGTFANGISYTGGVFAYSFSTAFVPTLDFSQTLQHHVGPWDDGAFGDITWSRTDGAATVTSNLSFIPDMIALNSPFASPVPEPSFYTLMLAGMVTVPWLARRRRT